jgi:hypothetical protein
MKSFKLFRNYYFWTAAKLMKEGGFRSMEAELLLTG